MDLVNLPWLELAVYVGNWPLKCRQARICLLLVIAGYDWISWLTRLWAIVGMLPMQCRFCYTCQVRPWFVGHDWLSLVDLAVTGWP